MIQKEDTFRAHLASIPDEEWKQLFALIDRIEVSLDSGILKSLKDKGVSRYEWWSSDNQVVEIVELHHLLHQLGLIISFDWPNWKYGQTLMQNGVKESDDLDLISLCKLLTMITRADRFNDSALYQSFIRGDVLTILKLIQKKKANH
jgi:hypothetical protein